MKIKTIYSVFMALVMLYKGAIAVTTRIGGNYTSWVKRISPTLIKFYLQNNNL